MSLQFVLGNSGSGKTTYLYENIVKDAAANPYKNYLVIVPEQFTMQTQRMLVDLSPNHAIMNIDVLSFKRLAYRIFDELGINDIEILEETGKNLVLRKVAQEKAERLSVFRPNINRIGYISEVKSLLSEFVQYNISPQALSNYAKSDRISELLRAKLNDVIVMYEGFEDFMRGKYITAEELLNVLGSVAHKSQILADSVLVFDEFTGFTPIQNELLRTLFKLVDKVYVTLTIDSREDFYHSRGMQELFDMPKKTISSLIRIAEDTNTEVLDPIVCEADANKRYCNSEELFFMEQNLFRRSYKQYGKDCKNLRVVSTKSPREEMVYVARQINELIQKNGYRYKDIAIVSGNTDIYQSYMTDILNCYQIPYFLDTTKEILFHPFIEFVRATLEIIVKDFSIESVFRFLRCGFCGIEDAKLDTLENYLLATGIRGKKAWSNRWLRVPHDDKNYVIAELEELRILIYDILQPVLDVFSKKDATVREQIIALYNMIISLDIENQLWEKEEEYLNIGNQVKSKEYGQIYRIVMSLFDKYIYILGEEKLTIKEFVEILDAGFDAAEVATIPPGFDCVTIGDIERTRLSDIKILFFIGVNDGIIPKSLNAGGIISQYERDILKEMDIELAPGAREQSFIQRFYLYLNMTKPSEKLYLCYHRTDKESKGLQKSYLINTINRMFPNLLQEHIEDILSELNVSTKKAAQEYVINGTEDDNWYALAKYFGVDELLDARFRYYEGNPISQTIAKAIYGNKIKGSVTRLEQYARCQYAHYLKYGLALREREISGLASVDIGNIYHEALLRFSNILEESDSYNWKNISDDIRDEFAKRALAEAIESYPSIIAYATAQEEYMLMRMGYVFKQTVWALTQQIKKGKFTPDKFEFKFEVDADENLSLNGRIDRIDRCNEDGKCYVKIIDYKSGNTSFDLIKLYHGVQLQLAVYMNAAMMAADIPGGMLYYHIDDPVLDISDDMSEEQIQDTLLGKLRPNGLINSDPDVIYAFDETLEKKSLVAPVSLKKDGTPDAYSSVASTEEFGIISEYTKNKISEIGKNIYAGNIEINPLQTAGIDSCKYCSYESICGINSKLPGVGAITESNIDKKNVMEEMEKVNAICEAKKGD